MIARPVLPGLTVRLRVETLETRSPASSLLDLAYLGLTATGDSLAAPKPDAPFVGIRPGLMAEESFDRPHTWAVPADDGKMADTQSATTSTTQSEGRRGDLLEIDTPAEQQPVFLLAFSGQPTATAIDTAPAPSSHAVGDVPTAPPPAAATELAAPLPMFFREPAPRVKVGDDPQSMPGIALSSYTGGGGGSGGGSTGPLPGGYVVGMKVQEVDFRGDEITVLADPGRTTYPGSHPPWAPNTPEWRDYNIDTFITDSDTEWAVPVAYKMGTKPVVAAKFKVTELGSAPASGAKKELTVRGLWRGYGVSMICPEVTVPADAAVGEYVYYPETPTLSSLPAYVNSVQSADIEWQYRIQGDMAWYAAGTSSNEMFVTLDQPAAGIPVYHTAISLSTRASWGATDPATVVSKTWNVFQTRAINAAYPAYKPPIPTPPPDPAPIRIGKRLNYYDNWKIDNDSTGELLQVSDGQCGSWAALLHDTLDMHGDIGGRRFWVRSTTRGEYLVVKSWTFDPAGGTGPLSYPYTVTPQNDWKYEQFVDGAWRYVWAATEMTDDRVASGQGPTIPRSLFGDHCLVLIDNKYYDPSYGTGPFNTLLGWETASLDGFLVSPGDGKMYVRRNLPAGPEVTEGKFGDP